MTCPKCGDPECRQCATCAGWECDHHEFIPVDRPAGCICDAMEWRDPEKIPPVCNQYVGDGKCSCHTCEHDKECHQ